MRVFLILQWSNNLILNLKNFKNLKFSKYFCTHWLPSRYGQANRANKATRYEISCHDTVKLIGHLDANKVLRYEITSHGTANLICKRPPRR